MRAALRYAGFVRLLSVIVPVWLALSPAPALATLSPTLTFDVRDEQGAPIPCKLTFIGQRGTPTPRFTRDDLARDEGESLLMLNRVFSPRGSGVIRVPPGTYDVYVSRGIEWDLFIARGLRVAANGATLRARLRHVVDTRGWLSADFHVHAAASSDSHVPMRDRISAFLSDGVELIVSTDHNVAADYAPVIRMLGAQRYITSLVGDEVTTNGWGHFGAFPITATGPTGRIPVGAGAAREFFQFLRRIAPEAIINVHHPRLDQEIGYFELGRFDARLDRAERAGFSFEFDALEVLNGYQESERRVVERMIDDWFALLSHGHLVTATGNSDSHHLDRNAGGCPRNYIRVRDDAPERIDPSEVPRALREHHALFTTGPFIRLSAGGADIGGLGKLRPDGKATAEIEVQAAPWVDVSLVRLYLNGREIERWPVTAGGPVVRLRQSFEVALATDGWLVARVDGDQPMSPVLGDSSHEVRPIALTNPVFLDANGNGRYDPPAHVGRH